MERVVFRGILHVSLFYWLRREKNFSDLALFSQETILSRGHPMGEQFWPYDGKAVHRAALFFADSGIW